MILLKENHIAKNSLAQEFSVGLGFVHDSKWFISSQFDYRNNERTKIKPRI